MFASDYFGRKYLASTSLFCMGVISIFMALTSDFWMFLVLLSIWGVVNSVGVGLSQVILVENSPDDRDKLLAKWGLYGSIGDVATPLFFMLLAVVGLNWKAAFLITGSLFIVISIYTLGCNNEVRTKEERKLQSLKERLSSAINAVKKIQTSIWMYVLIVASLLDEILISFSALHLHASLNLSEYDRNVILTLFMICTVVGYKFVSKLLDRYSKYVILFYSILLTSLCLFVFSLSIYAPLTILSFLMAGIFSTAIYPIASARAYECLPQGEEGTMFAISSTFTVVGSVIPILLGVLAVRYGTSYAVFAIGLFTIASILFLGHDKTRRVLL
jgi:MFS family permease